jgi:hypothetical protein
MWMATVVALLLGLMVLFADLAPPVVVRFDRDRALARNFTSYRNAVIRYVEEHPEMGGSVAPDHLSLPPGWQPLSALHNEIREGQVAIWAFLPAAAQVSVEREVAGSESIGVAEIQDGAEWGYSELDGTRFPVPAGVPLGAMVSVVNVK